MTAIPILLAAGFFVLNALQATEPAAFDQLIRQAQIQQQKADFAGAARSYGAALKLRPEMAELHANLALMEYQTGNHKESVEQFRQALKLKPDLFVPNLFLGKEYIRMQNPAAALPFLEKARQLNARDVELSLTLGRAYLETHAFGKASEAYRSALSLAPNNEDAWYGLGASYLDRAQEAGAILARRYPDSSFFRKLQAEYRQNQTNSAEAPSPLPVSSQPEIAAAFQDGRYRQAADDGDKLIAERKYDASVLYWTVEAGTKAAVEAFEHASGINPASPRLHLLLGDLYRHKGDTREAENEFQKALAIEPRATAALIGLATTYYLDRRLEQAETAVRQVLRQAPGDPEGNVLMAQILVEQKRYAEAEPFLRVPVGENGELAGRAHALRGKLLAVKGMTRGAVREYEMAAPYDDDGSIHYALGKQYQLLGDEKGAQKAFEQSKRLRSRANQNIQIGAQPGDKN